MNMRSIYNHRPALKVCCALMLLMASASGHAADPTQQPLLQSSDIFPIGSFSLPSTFAYGGQSLAVSADGNKLYISQHNEQQNLGIINIPPSLTGTATTYQAPTYVPGDVVSANSARLGGSLVYNNRLIIAKRVMYDGGTPPQQYSYTAGDLNISNFSPISAFGNVWYQTWVSGYMGVIPADWQSLLGGPAFTGNSSMSIISRGSNGPSFFVFDPDDVGVNSPIPSIPLMYYYYLNDSDYQPIANPYAPNDIWTRADQNNAGTIFPAGTRSILFFSKHGYGQPTYKSMTADPCDPSGQGEQAYPYRRQITAFDANDLLAVKNGTKQPWEVQPYAWWELPDGSNYTCESFAYSGLAYDPDRRRIYVAYNYGMNPAIEVYGVKVLITQKPISAAAGGGGGGGGCFIATAAYGSSLDKHVRILSEFRDRFLLPYCWGKKFVGWYYRNSPSLAHKLKNHPIALETVRWALLPAVGFSYLSVALHPAAAVSVCVVLLWGVVWAVSRGWANLRRRKFKKSPTIRALPKQAL